MPHDIEDVTIFQSILKTNTLYTQTSITHGYQQAACRY